MEKEINASKRGITFSDERMPFKVGEKVVVDVDRENNKLILQDISKKKDPKQREYMVSRKGANQLPLIDIRYPEFVGMFKDATNLIIEFEKDEVIITGIQKKKANSIVGKVANSIADKTTSIVEKAKSILKKPVSKIIVLNDYSSYRTLGQIKMSINDFEEAYQKVAGGSVQLSIFDTVDESPTRTKPATVTPFQKAIKLALEAESYFCGAGLLDKAFQLEGFDIKFGLELMPDMAATYRRNVGDHVRVGNIDTYTGWTPNAPIMSAGTKCQGMSGANRHTHVKESYLENEDNHLTLSYIERIENNPNCKVWVLENVPGIFTIGNGALYQEICERMSDFEITSGVLNSADFGSAQSRERAILMGSKIGKIPLPEPTHIGRHKTVREAFEGLHNGIPNQMDFSNPKPETIERMKHVPMGGNWQSIPEHLRTSKMGKSTQSTIYKRLRWDEPSITIVNPRKSNITHPELNRSLSIRECARLFDVEDDFVFCGSLSNLQQMICNAVPINLGRAVARVIRDAVERFNSSVIKPVREKIVIPALKVDPNGQLCLF